MISELRNLLLPLAPEMEALERGLQKSLSLTLPLIKKARKFMRRRGKRLRPALVILFGKMLNGREEEYMALAQIVEIVHLASLIHDDVIDNALKRRGGESLNQIFDNRRSVSIGDFLLSLSLEMIVPFYNFHYLQIFAKTVREMCEGEMMELQPNFSFSRKYYLTTIEKKTASLFGAACAFGAISAGREDPGPYLKFGKCLGMAFQIKDDVLDYAGEEKITGKEIFQDLKEGKITLPLLAAVEKQDRAKKAKIKAWIASPRKEQVRKIVALVKEGDGVKKAEKLAQGYLKQARKILPPLPEGKYAETLDKLMIYIIERKQ